MKSILFLLQLSTLVCLAVSENFWVRKLQSRSDYMITSMIGNYAIKSLRQGWEVAYVNGDKLVTISSECKETVYTLPDQKEIRPIVDNVKSDLEQQVADDVCSIHIGNGRQKSLEVIFYNQDGSTENTISLNMIHSKEEIAIVREASVFFQEGVLTIIFRNGKILMKPAACITQQEHGFLDLLRSAERDFGNARESSEKVIKSTVEEFVKKLSAERNLE